MTGHHLQAALEAGAVDKAAGKTVFTDYETALWSADAQAWQQLTRKAQGSLRSYLADIDIAAAAFRVEAIPSLNFSLYRRFDSDGDRLAFETAYFSRRRRLTTLALSYLLWRKAVDLADLEAIIWAINDEYSWALPAHLNGRSLLDGGHETAIELFAAESALALAEIIFMTGPVLSPVIVYRSQSEIFRRVLKPLMEKTVRYNWETMKTNWAAVCAAAIGMTALYLLDDLGAVAVVLERLWPCFKNFISGFTDDGACLEGLSYWNYGMGFFTAFAELLRDRTANRIDLLLSQPKLERIAAFQDHLYLNDHYAASFADSSATEAFRLGLTSRLVQRFNSCQWPPASRAASFFDDPCGRWALAVRDLIWASAAIKTKPLGHQAKPFYYFPVAQWLIRPADPAGGLALAAKAGHNDEAHNHNDIGSFILAADTDLFLVDLGAGEYNKAYFSADRYKLFFPSSFSHSLPIIDDHGQAAGYQFRASDVSCFEAEGKLTFQLDIAGAYDKLVVAGLGRLHRLFRLKAAGVLSEIWLQDDFELQSGGHQIRERFVSQLSPELDASGRLVLKGSVGKLWIEAEGPLEAPVISKHRQSGHDGSRQTIFTIDFPVSKTLGDLSCQFRFRYEALDRRQHLS